MTESMVGNAIHEVTGSWHPAVVTIGQFAQIFGISGMTTRRMIDRGDLATLRLPGLSSVRIPVSEVYRVFGVPPQVSTDGNGRLQAGG
jgi:excisionase family DNA binding protein